MRNRGARVRGIAGAIGEIAFRFGEIIQDDGAANPVRCFFFGRAASRAWWARRARGHFLFEMARETVYHIHHPRARSALNGLQ